MELSVLEVFKAPNPKRRLGKDNDGGYVICDYPKNNDFCYDLFLSGGVGDDISFEEQFISENPEIKCFAYDGTINESDFIPGNDNITYIHKNIGFFENDNETNLHTFLDSFSNIFIKMDIEGHEFPWLNSLSIKQLRSIKQIVIEFHHPMTSPDMWLMLKKIAQTHWLVHLHPHNGCGYVEATFVKDNITHNTKIPRVFECTYIRKEYLEPNDEQIPSKIDQSNSPQVPDYYLTGYPYTTYNVFEDLEDEDDIIALSSIKVLQF